MTCKCGCEREPVARMEEDRAVIYRPKSHDGTYMPDRITDGSIFGYASCSATRLNWSCTLPYNHPAYTPHIAGTGKVIAAMWYEEEASS